MLNCLLPIELPIRLIGSYWPRCGGPYWTPLAPVGCPAASWGSCCTAAWNAEDLRGGEEEEEEEEERDVEEEEVEEEDNVEEAGR